jgi:hypothetical protein
MPKPTSEDYWQARKELPENPYSNDDLERIVQIIEAGEKDQLSPAEMRPKAARMPGGSPCQAIAA